MDKTPATSLASQYQACAVEPQVHTWWQEHNAFAARPEDPGDPYSIVIPPPNVTAALHMGHALNNTLQDILTRYHRMRGLNTCWFPGTDHAGIATQTVVEKRVLQEEGKRRTDFDRESFVAKIQAWKDEYEERITDQLVAMGCSCDWQRQAFTLDDVRARAVREAFFGLFKDGLIYRGKRLVNWDPVTQTALADDEVEMVEIDGHFWYMKYPLVDASGHDTGEHVTVATTRPETMLGDTAVAVNPNDAARKHLISQHVRLPIVNRIIPIIGDDYVVIPDPESEDAKAKFASGFLKVTPAHDPNDYEIGRRHDLALINVMAPDGTISRNHGWPAEENIHEAAGFLGLDRYEAREAIVAWFRTQGLLEEVRPYRHSVGHSYRSHVAIEPYLSDQWYVKVTDDRLCGAALRAMAPDQKTAPNGALKDASKDALKDALKGASKGASKGGTDVSSVIPPALDALDGGTDVSSVIPPALDALDGGTDVSSVIPPALNGVTDVPSVTESKTQPSTPKPSFRRRSLPHWEIGGSTYFITFRLAKGTLTQVEQIIVAEACKHWHQQKAVIHLLTVMPDHVHLLLTPVRQDDQSWFEVPPLIQSIKSFSAHEINKLRNSQGTVWQTEFFDRIVRDEDEFLEKWNYIWMNPVKAGLVSDPDTYPFTTVPEQALQGGAALRADDGRDVRPTIKPKAIKPNATKPTENKTWEGGLHFHPARYAKTFQLWHENIRDWCISRQLWWGHRIPVWSFWPAASQDMPDPQIANQDEFAKRFHKALTELEKAFGLKDVFCFKYSSENGSGYLAARTEQAVQILSTLESYIATTSGPNSVGKPHFADADKDSASFRLLELVGPEFTQDPDVLDTWFSSALWPLSTMGWPDMTPELEKWNPTNVLCTAREIITLWVSRMVMFNLYFTDRLPFRDVFIHAMIQDGHGQKMSKSLGNGVDPMDIIHSHGSDAMRYTLASMTTHTQDVRMPVDLVDPHSGQAFTPKFIRTSTGHMVAGPVQDSPADAARKMVSSFGLASGQATPDATMPLARNTSEKFDHGRNFANKLWNAARFAMTHLDVDDGDFKPDQPGRIGPRHSELTIVSHWILSRLGRTVRQCEKAIAHYEFAQYSQVLYDFFWRDLCDWYIEAIKPTVRQSHAQRHALATCLDVSLRLMHPVMPFITERLFAALNETFPQRGVEGITIPPAELLVKAAWPTVDDMILRPDVEAEFAKVQNVVTMIREVRTTMKVPPRQRVEVSGCVNADYLVPALLEKVWVEHLANVEVVAMDTDVTKPEGAAVVVRPNVEIYLHNQLDTETERTRLTQRLAEIRKSIQTLQGRLASASYVQKAPPHLVEQTKSQLADNQAELVGLERQLADLPPA